jgi:hypothetical protein
MALRKYADQQIRKGSRVMARASPHLGSGLIVRKGEATPTTTTAPAQSIATAPTPPRGVSGTIAVTVRLDPERYERLKMHGVKTRNTNQQILVAALDAYLASQKP